VLGVAAVVVVVAALWFEPWKLVVDATVAEPAPPAVSVTETVARGTLISHEHGTSGSVALLRLPDGALVLRLADLVTSNGPKLKVWLSDAPVLPGREGWHVFDDGRFLDLGDLKGNLGSANYPVPAGADLRGLTSVSIWCERFAVSFGAATLST
jgi:hypothetical protein